MAIINGSDGIVKFGTDNFAHVQSWNIDLSAEVTQTSSMGDEWGDAMVGIKSWSGSLECYLDTTDEGQDGVDVGTVITLNLYPSGDATGERYFSGQAVVSGIPRSASKTGPGTFTVNFSGKGALSKLTAA